MDNFKGEGFVVNYGAFPLVASKYCSKCKEFVTKNAVSDGVHRICKSKVDVRARIKKD